MAITIHKRHSHVDIQRNKQSAVKETKSHNLIPIITKISLTSNIVSIELVNEEEKRHVKKACSLILEQIDI